MVLKAVDFILVREVSQHDGVMERVLQKVNSFKFHHSNCSTRILAVSRLSLNTFHRMN